MITYPNMAKLLALTFGGFTKMKDFAEEYGEGNANEAVESFTSELGKGKLKDAEKGAKALLKKYPKGLPEINDKSFTAFLKKDKNAAIMSKIIADND